jgi:hypothetical protein
MARAQLPSPSLGEGLLARTVLNEDGGFGFGETNLSADDEEIRPAVVRVCATAAPIAPSLTFCGRMCDWRISSRCVRSTHAQRVHPSHIPTQRDENV